MTLTIITINWNNAAGLEKTMKSVLGQVCTDFEYVVVDGASDDGSVDIIEKYAGKFGERLKWISEKDKGIYNAMNKGIGMASGEYVEFLNSGDCLAAPDVTGKMLNKLRDKGFPSILYGNMLKDMPDGRLTRDRCFAGSQITLLGMYKGCLNHSPAYIKHELFTKYGLYDETLKICSDWKWYMNAIVLGEEIPSYIDIDVTIFDMTGISETNKNLLEKERSKLLSEMIPAPILADYHNNYQSLMIVHRLKKHPAFFEITWFMERCLFKLEKVNKYIKNER